MCGMPAPDLATVEATLSRLFAELRVSPLRKLSSGFGSVVVETADGVIFRIARTQRAADGHAMEARLLPRLRRRVSLELPYPHWLVTPDPAAFAFGAIGYPKLGGVPLAADAAALSAGTAPTLAIFLSELHRFPLTEAEAAGVPDATEAGAAFASLRAAVLPLLADHLDRAELSHIERWCDEFAGDPLLNSYQPALRHGDFWYGNILVDETETPIAVIDWERASLGDPAIDLARQLHLGVDFAGAVVAEYESRTGRRDGTLWHRVERHWQLLDFAGFHDMAELDDPTELEDAVAKLRAGPILSPA